MAGRYGPDHLNAAIFVAALIVSVIARFTNVFIITYVSYLLLALAIFRMLSRNIPKRRAENDKFIRFWWPIKQKLKGYITRLKDSRTHKYFRCPSCKNTLRVPRGKGKLQITCPKCGERFFKKT
jgi:predicted RNA-binding Zn-ribbon protein involved in translation (DUF1610 family)